MLVRFVALSLAGVAAAAPAQPGLKIVTRESWSNGVVETTAYVQAERRRVETRMDGRETIQITRCDRQQTIALDSATRSYMSSPVQLHPNRLVTLLASLSARSQKPQPAPTRLIETTTVQTSERKTAFGHIARRVIVTRRDIPLQGGGAPAELRTDGWYVDVEARPACERFDGRTYAFLTASRHPGAARELPVIAFKDIGPPERGLPIELTTTSHASADEGGAALVSRREVTQLSYLRPHLADAEKRFIRPASDNLHGIRCSVRRGDGAAWASRRADRPRPAAC